MEHMTALLRRYFWVMLAGTVLAAGLGLVLLALTGGPPPLALSVLPIVVASFDGGRQYRWRLGLAPGLTAGLTLTLCYFLVGLALFGVVFLGGLASAGMVGEIASIAPALALPSLFFMVIWLGTIRVRIWFGARIAP